MRKTKSIVADLLHVLRGVRHNCVTAEEYNFTQRNVPSEHKGGKKNV